MKMTVLDTMLLHPHTRAQPITVAESCDGCIEARDLRGLLEVVHRCVTAQLLLRSRVHVFVA